MSEVITLTNGGTGKIYGTFAGAQAYIAGAIGEQYTAWLELADDDARKQALIGAARRLNRLGWIETASTFALRDAIVSADVDGDPPFQAASYELAALAASDDAVLTEPDDGSNIKMVDAGGAGVTYFNPTSSRQGSATVLPSILMDLVGQYLAASDSGGSDGGSGQSGDSRNPFDSCDSFDRTRPY